MNETLRMQEKDDFDLVVHGSPEHVSHGDTRYVQGTDHRHLRLKHFGTRTPIMKSGTGSSKKSIQISQLNSSTFFANWMLYRQNFT